MQQPDLLQLNRLMAIPEETTVPIELDKGCRYATEICSDNQ
jgi:hypothetical protein